MKKTAMLLAVFTVGACAQTLRTDNLDLSSLDKLKSKAKEVSVVSLNREQLQAAMKMMPRKDKEKGDGDMVKGLMSGLDSVQVRDFEFEKPGMYSDSDLDSIRDQVSKMHGCSAIVDSKEKDEHSTVYICTVNGKSTGLAVIDSEPKEISVVFVKGAMDMSDLGKLGGLMGMPKMELGPQQRGDHASKSDE